LAKCLQLESSDVAQGLVFALMVYITADSSQDMVLIVNNVGNT